MTRPTEVLAFNQTTDLDYPRLLSGHPLNEEVDFRALGRYAEEGSPAEPVRFDLFVKSRWRFDAVWIAGIVGPLVSMRLRSVLEDVVGDCLEFLPLAVNGEPFWILRVTKVVDALDLARSEIDYDASGAVSLLNVPVWLGERLEDPLLFTTPQQPRRTWATPRVAAAYERSGCDGLSFYPRGKVA